MLKRKQLFILFMVVPGLLITLVVLQWYWMKDTYRLKEVSFNEQVSRAVRKTAMSLDKQLFSWNLYSKAYLTAGQGIVLYRHDHGGGALTDTMTMYNAFPYPNRPDTCFYKTNTSYFDVPTLVDINMRIEYLSKEDATDFPVQNKLLHNLTEENYRSLLDDPVRLTRQLSGVDTLLRNALKEEGIDSSYAFAVTRNNSTVAVANRGSEVLQDLLRSPFHAELFSSRPFIQPYHLYVLPDNKDALIMKSMRSLIILSGLLVLALCGVFVYFFVIVLRQKRLSEMKTDFINNMTHEFMTPVTNIGLAIETMERNGTDKQHNRRLMDMIVHENSHLRDNINRVLQVATMDRGEYNIHTSAIDLNDVLRRVTKSFDLNLQQLNARVNLSLEARRSIVHADETHVINLFYNIIDNSIKYHVPGRRLMLLVSTENTGAWLKVSVEDNGKGMDSKVQKQAFNKFYRGGNGNTHDVKGFGLGLNYVRSIADVYGWKVELKSAVDKGTSITIWIKVNDEGKEAYINGRG